MDELSTNTQQKCLDTDYNKNNDNIVTSDNDDINNNNNNSNDQIFNNNDNDDVNSNNNIVATANNDISSSRRHITNEKNDNNDELLHGRNVVDYNINGHDTNIDSRKEAAIRNSIQDAKFYTPPSSPTKISQGDDDKKVDDDDKFSSLSSFSVKSLSISRNSIDNSANASYLKNDPS